MVIVVDWRKLCKFINSLDKGESGRVTDRQAKTEDKGTDKDRHTEADIHKGTESGKVRQRDRLTDTKIDWQTARQTDRQTDTKIDWQTARQTDRETD